MAVYSVGLITFVFAVVFLDGIESRPQPAVHHYKYNIEDGGGDAGGQGGADFGGNPGGAFFQYKTSSKADLGHHHTSLPHTNLIVDTGVARPRGTDCNRGLIDKAVAFAGNTLNGLASKLESTVSGIAPEHGLVNNVGKGLDDLFEYGIRGIKRGLEDTACGLGNIADEIAKGIDTGKIPKEVKSIAREFFGGLGNIGRDITSAFSQAAISLASDVSNLG